MPAKITNPEAHFWSRVERVGADECWSWTGGLNKDGYGSVNLRIGEFRETLAHRAAFYFEHGWVPVGGNRKGTLLLRHSCDNRRCCNPAHLSIGTQKQNMEDCVARGRTYDRRGDRHPRARLSVEAVGRIRGGEFDGLSHAKVAAKFGVSAWAIRRIRLGRGWTEVRADGSGCGVEPEIVQ